MDVNWNDHVNAGLKCHINLLAARRQLFNLGMGQRWSKLSTLQYGWFAARLVDILN